MFKFQTCRGEEITEDVAYEDLDSVYRNALSQSSPTITWNDLGDPVLIVAIGDGYSIVSLMRNDTWYYLAIGGGEKEVSVDVAGSVVDLPQAVVLPFELGLRVLKSTRDFEHLVQTYSWIEQ